MKVTGGGSGRVSIAGYALWRDGAVFAQLNYDLTGLARVKEGRAAEPSAAIIDTQSVKTSTNPPVGAQGVDAAKKIVGRKRSIATDTLGLLLAVIAIAASVTENKAGIQENARLDHAPPQPCPRLRDFAFEFRSHDPDSDD